MNLLLMFSVQIASTCLFKKKTRKIHVRKINQFKERITQLGKIVQGVKSKVNYVSYGTERLSVIVCTECRCMISTVVVSFIVFLALFDL